MLLPHRRRAGDAGVAINDQWDEFTAFRIKRENERLYPHTHLYEAEQWPMGRAT